MRRAPRARAVHLERDRAPDAACPAHSAVDRLRAGLAVIALAGAAATGCTESGVVLGPPPGRAPIRADTLTAGPYHTCTILGGRLSCWGSNAMGQLGVGDVVDHTSPAPVEGDDWVEVAAGERHACARREGGSLWCWGDNDQGQLGIGPSDPVSTPEFVSIGAPIVQLGSLYSHTCAVDQTGALHCWGANLEGQLAQDDPFPGDGVDRDTPVRVGSDSDWLLAHAGQGHTCGLRAPGVLWCWGRNINGELGIGEGTPGQIRVPWQVGSASDWIDVRGGQGSSCGLRAPGALHCWGENGSGETGLGDTAVRFEPVQVGGATDWRVVALDTFHACGVRSDGALYCWGRNVEGQLGTGDNEPRLVPTRIGDGADWASVATGRFHTCALRKDGSVWCTGQNNFGQLGLGDPLDRTELTQVEIP